MISLTKYSKWYNIILNVRYNLSPHDSITISKNTIEHPLKAGFRKTIGEPMGQIADYEYVLSDGSRIHVREYENAYEVHWDIRSPTVDPAGHLLYDAPHILLSAMLGSISGLKEYFHSKDYVKALVKGLTEAFFSYLILRAFIHS